MDKNKIVISLSIVISAILISAAILYTNSNNRYKVAGGRVFDTKIGKYIAANKIQEFKTPLQTFAPLPTPQKFNMDEINRLIEDKRNGKTVSILKWRIVKDYYKTQLNIWSKQYETDNKNGKIINYSKYDYRRIQLGTNPIGTYKNKKDEPFWYQILVEGIN